MNRYKTLLFILISTPTLAQAQVPVLQPLNINARYDVSLGAVPVGHIFINASETPLNYQMRIDTKSQGIVEIFAPLKSIAETKGRHGEHASYIPGSYYSTAIKDGDETDRHVKITYDGDGNITERERVPGDSPSYRPVVPLADADAACDPITSFYRLRALLRDAMAANQREVSINNYDGAHLGTWKLQVVSRARVEVMGKYIDAINTVFIRAPINGYTKKELKKYAEGDPIVHIYFSANGQLIPLMATVTVPFGELKAVLTKGVLLP